MRVSTVDDDISLLAERQELLNEVIDGRASHDQEHHTAGFLELGNEFLDGVGSDNGLACGLVSIGLEIDGVDVFTFGLILQEAVDLGNGSVESNDSEAVVGSVQNQILAHDRKANKTEITTGFGLRRADLEASQSRSRVSMLAVNGCDHEGNKWTIQGAESQQKEVETYTAPDMLADD